MARLRVDGSEQRLGLVARGRYGRVARRPAPRRRRHVGGYDVEGYPPQRTADAASALTRRAIPGSPRLSCCSTSRCKSGRMIAFTAVPPEGGLRCAAASSSRIRPWRSGLQPRPTAGPRCLPQLAERHALHTCHPRAPPTGSRPAAVAATAPPPASRRAFVPA